MEIGTPFGTIEFGGIECGNGIRFGNSRRMIDGFERKNLDPYRMLQPSQVEDIKVDQINGLDFTESQATEGDVALWIGDSVDSLEIESDPNDDKPNLDNYPELDQPFKVDVTPDSDDKGFFIVTFGKSPDWEYTVGIGPSRLSISKKDDTDSNVYYDEMQISEYAATTHTLRIYPDSSGDFRATASKNGSQIAEVSINDPSAKNDFGDKMTIQGIGGYVYVDDIRYI